METETPVQTTRAWRQFLKNDEAKLILKKEIRDARMINISTVNSGERLTDSYRHTDEDFSKGQDIAYQSVEAWFKVAFQSQNNFEKKPEIADNFQDTGHGWQLWISGSDLLEVLFEEPVIEVPTEAADAPSKTI